MGISTYEARSIIACIDGSAHTQAVLDAAIWSAHELNAPIGLLHAHDKAAADLPNDLSGNIGFGSRESLLGELAKVDAMRNKLISEHGDVLLAEATNYVTERIQKDSDAPKTFKLHRHETLKDSISHLQSDVQLVILGQKGADEDTPNEHVGSQLETAIRSARQPVLVVTEQFTPPTSVLYAFDNRNNTLQGLDWLVKHPLFTDAHIHLVFVTEDTPENHDALQAASAKLKQRGLTVTPILIQGSAKRDLIRYQKEQGLDMLIMGAYGHSRLREFFMGSTTQELLQSNQNSILMLRF